MARLKNNKIMKATRLAEKRLKERHRFEYLALLNEARAEVGLPPSRSPAVWVGCGIPEHDRSCMCDLVDRSDF